MFNLKGLCGVFVFALALKPNAGPGHSHHSTVLISSSDASALASERLNEHIDQGIIDSGWKDVPVSNVTQDDAGYGADWTAWLERTAGSDVKRLKIFFGEHRAMNIQP